MRPDVHAAALRSAAKLVFGMASLVACTKETSEDATTTDNSAVTSATKKKNDDCCTEKLKETFPTQGGYQWTPVPQSADVVACCDKELTKHEASSKYRWDCCVAYDPATVPDGGEPEGIGFSGGHGMACTPWGPPVPPAMKRRMPKRVDQQLVA